MEEKYVLVSYINPDLDGISCMYAYKEFIEKCDRKASLYISGIPKKEVKIVCDMFKIKLNPISKISKNDNLILVDTNTDLYLEDCIIKNKDNVTEIIDHHIKSKNIEKFSNANITIESVGAAATLVTNRFIEYDMNISDNAAILLYYGIVSNTINFKSKLTTQKDIDAAKWLKSKCNKIDDRKIKEIFIRKSNIEKELLYDEMEAKNKVFINDKYSVIIGQLEITNINEFLKENETQIKNILENEKIQKAPEYIFCNIVDILEGYSILYTPDELTKKMLSEKFNYSFDHEKNISKIEKLITRKELFKNLRDKLY